jgi:hypothetical protein
MFVDGQSYGEYLQRQDQLNQSLTRDMPLGSFEKPLRVALTQEQINEVLNTPSTPLRIGAVTELENRVDIVGLKRKTAKVGAPESAGTLTQTADGGLVWALTLSSSDAGAIRVHVENLRYPTTLRFTSSASPERPLGRTPARAPTARATSGPSRSSARKAFCNCGSADRRTMRTWAK